MAGKWVKKYLSGDVTAEEKLNYEQIERAVQGGVSISYDDFTDQCVEFQEMWRDLYQAHIAENISSLIMALGLETQAKDILSYTYCKDEGQAILRSLSNG